MPEEQRSLAGYKSPAHKQEDFPNVNEGKPILNDSDEYVFSLKAIPRVRTMPVEKEDKNTREKKKVMVDKAICEFVEESTGNVVATFFRIDSLNFSDEDTFESAVVRFFKKIKRPLPHDQDVEDWTQHFIVGMRFRGRIAVKQSRDKDNDVVTKYYLDIPTCRPILASDMHPDAAATLPNHDASKTPDNAALLAKAKLIACAAASKEDAIQRLLQAQVGMPTISAFKKADEEGLITYPIP